MIIHHSPSGRSKDVPPNRRCGRPRRRCRVRVGQLEDRILLSGRPIVATPEELARARPLTGDTATGTIAAGGVDLFRIDPTTDQLLIAQVYAKVAHTRLSLLDGQGHLLVQSDGLTSANRDDLISQHLTAGTDYLAVEGLGGASDYTLTTKLTDAKFPNTPIEGTSSAIVVGDFDGDGRLDLAIAPNDEVAGIGFVGVVSVLLGTGDGTFQEPVDYAVGTDAAALVAGDFDGDGRLDLAVAGTVASSDFSVVFGGVVSVLLGVGDGTFQEPVDYAVGTGSTLLARSRGTSTATGGSTWPSPHPTSASTSAASCRCCGCRRRDVPGARDHCGGDQ